MHAQQAAKYIRGLNDTIKSHPTAPMLSSLLLQFVSHTFTDETIDHNIHESINNKDENESEHEHEHHDELFEPVKLHLSVDRSGRLLKQIKLTTIIIEIVSCMMFASMILYGVLG